LPFVFPESTYGLDVISVAVALVAPPAANTDDAVSALAKTDMRIGRRRRMELPRI
jgi:hypothetical protein